MPREDGRNHGGVGQRLPLEELVLHALVGVPEIRLMERGDSEHGSTRGEDALPGMSLGLWRVWMRQPPLHWGARSCFVGAGMREAASAALCWLSPAVLGSPAAGCSTLQMVPSSLGTTPSDLGTMPKPCLHQGWPQLTACASKLPLDHGRERCGACVPTHTAWLAAPAAISQQTTNLAWKKAA